MSSANSPQENKQDLLRQLGAATKALGESLGWLDWITNNKFAWGCVIAISGFASFLVGKGYSAQNCPDLRDMLINTTVPIAVVLALVYVIRVKKTAIDYIKKIVSTGLVFLAPVVLTVLIYPVATNWDVTQEWIGKQFCPPCLRDINEAQRLQTEAEKHFNAGRIQDAEKSLYAAEQPYARQAVADKCKQANYVLAEVLNRQADVFKMSGKKQEGIQKRKEALELAKECAEARQCPPEFLNKLKVQLTLDSKDAAELKAANQAIPRGASTTLQWFAEGAVSASLDGATVGLFGERKISPTQTTDYTLQVSFSDGTAKTLKTKVVVYSLSVKPLIVPAGGASTITWSAEGASKVALDGQLVGIQGSRTATYSKTTNHILRVTFPDNNYEDIAANVLVYSFSANPKHVRPGEASTLSWSVDSARQVTLEGQGVAAQGSMVVTPTQTIHYNLRINYPNDTITASETINVIPFSLKATPQFIDAGESSRIEWSCPQSLECTLDGQKASVSGSRIVKPVQTTDYELGVKFPDGSSRKLVSTVTVGQGKCDPAAYSALGYDQVIPTLLQKSMPGTPSIRNPNVFAQPESSITLTGDEIICLASTPDGRGDLNVDDQIDFRVAPRDKAWVQNYYDPVTKGIKSFPAQNITWMFAAGNNRLRLILTDTVCCSFSTTDIWLVIWRR